MRSAELADFTAEATSGTKREDAPAPLPSRHDRAPLVAFPPPSALLHPGAGAALVLAAQPLQDDPSDGN